MGRLVLTIISTNCDLTSFPERIDWRQIAADIREAGMSYNCQATELGLGWSTMQTWLEGKGIEPRYAQGSAWLNLHTQMCGVKMTLERLKST
jgi:hypothetical protein